MLLALFVIATVLNRGLCTYFHFCGSANEKCNEHRLSCFKVEAEGKNAYLYHIKLWIVLRFKPL